MNRYPPDPDYCLRAHSAPVTCLRFVGAATRLALASGDTDGEFKLWDLVLQRPVIEWAASTEGLLEIHEHAGGRELLTQARDGRVKLWDMERIASGATPDASLSRSLHTDAFHFTRCAVANRRSTTSQGHSSAANGNVPDSGSRATLPDQAPSTEFPKVKRHGEDEFEGHDARLHSDQDSVQGQRRASSELRASNHEHDPGDTANELSEDAEPQADAHSVGSRNPVFEKADAADYLLLAPSDALESMTLWDTRCRSYAQRLELDETASKSLGMCMSSKLWLPSAHSNGQPPLAFLGYENGDIIAWDITMMQPRIHTRCNLLKSPVMGLDISADGRRIFVAGVEPKARVCKLQSNGRVVQRGPPLPVNCESSEHAKDGVGQLALRPDGRLFATGGWDYRIRLFSAKAPTFKPLAVLRYHDASINALDFSPDSTLLAAGSKDFKISIWSLYPPC